MRYHPVTLIFCLSFIAISCSPGFRNADSQISLVPKPVEVQKLNGFLELEDSIAIYASDTSLADAIALSSSFFQQNGFVPFVTHSEDKARLSLRLAPSDMPREGYQLLVDSIRIVVEAPSANGIINGLASLQSISYVDKDSEFLQWLGATNTYFVPACRIVDYPQFAWRGLLLDASRHFFTVAETKNFIDLMYRYKLNVLHWHLTDDQGWRIEIKKYPALTSVGSKRAQSMLSHHTDPKPYTYDGFEHGGFYTQEEIKDIVKYAQDRGIVIVPEIEMPGHAVSALAAYPSLGCKGGPYHVGTDWGVYDDIYCGGNEETYAFLNDVLDEVITLFPGEYIHIGGDEVPKTQWNACARCQAKIKEENLGDAIGLQSYFIERIREELEKKGRKAICWEDVMESNLNTKVTVMAWKDPASAMRAANLGNNAILAAFDPLYFNKIEGHEYEPVKGVYDYYPIPATNQETALKHVMGAQGCIWTEYIEDYNEVQYATFPRALALAEILWSPPATRNWNDFRSRLDLEILELKSMGINYRSPEE